MLTLVLIVLTSGYPFFPLYSNGEPLKRASTPQVRIATPTRNIPEASEVGTPLYSGHFRWQRWCPHYRGSTVVHTYSHNSSPFPTLCTISSPETMHACAFTIHSALIYNLSITVDCFVFVAVLPQFQIYVQSIPLFP